MPPGRIERPLVVIPAYNEAATVAQVIEEIRRHRPSQDIVVVDDGSTDATGRVAAGAGAVVLSLPINLGVGGAMRTGFKYAVRHGYDAVVQVDADGQHRADYLDALIARAGQGCHIVIGARFAGVGDYTVRGPRRWAMRVFARVMSRATGHRLTDVTSGFRVTSGPALELFAREFPEEYLGDTLESLVIATRAGLSVGQVPVAMRTRAHGRPSQSVAHSLAYLARATLVIVLAQWRRGPAPTVPDRAPSVSPSAAAGRWS